MQKSSKGIRGEEQKHRLKFGLLTLHQENKQVTRERHDGQEVTVASAPGAVERVRVDPSLSLSSRLALETEIISWLTFPRVT